MLGRFHTSMLNIVLIKKYIEGSYIEESLKQTQVFGVNVVNAVLN